MNKERRKSVLGALSLIAQAKEVLETARDEEQEYLENMPEGLQGGDKGSAAEEAITALEEAIDSLDEIDSNVTAGIGA